MLFLVAAAWANPPCSAEIGKNEGVGVAFDGDGNLHCASPGSIDVYAEGAWTQTPVRWRTPPRSYVLFDPKGTAWYAFAHDGIELRSSTGASFPAPRASSHQFTAGRSATTLCWNSLGVLPAEPPEFQPVLHWAGRARWVEDGTMRYDQTATEERVLLACDEPNVAWKTGSLYVDGKALVLDSTYRPLVLDFPQSGRSVVWLDGCDLWIHRNGERSSTRLPFRAGRFVGYHLGEVTDEHAIIVATDELGISLLKLDKNLEVVAHRRIESVEGTVVAASPEKDGEVCVAERVVSGTTIGHDVHCFSLK